MKNKKANEKISVSIADVKAQAGKQKKARPAVSIADAKAELEKRKSAPPKKDTKKQSDASVASSAAPRPAGSGDIQETPAKKLDQIVEEDAKEELTEITTPVVTPTPILTLEEETERAKTAAPRERDVITEQQKTYSERKVGATYSSGAAAQAGEFRAYLLETKMFGASQLNPQTLEQMTWGQRDTLFKMAERSTGMSLEANYAEIQRTVQQTFTPGRQYMQSGPAATEMPKQGEEEGMRKYFGKTKTS